MPPPSSAAPPSGSASAIVAAATSGYHVLRIDGYSRTKSVVPNGKHIESRPFRVAGHTWALRYYPNGYTSDAASYISCYLLLKAKSPAAKDDVMVQLVFSFVDQTEKQMPSHVRSRAANKFSPKSSCWGLDKFVKREDLERSDRLKDDCFTLRCDMIVAGAIRTEDYAAAVQTTAAAPLFVVPPPDWTQHFRALLRSGHGADVQFLVECKTFAAHRCVLAARSPVFSAELYGAMKEAGATTAANNSVVVQVDDMRADVFENLLHFVYTDSLQETEEGQQQQQETNISMAQHLLVAADRYGMERLKLICEDKLCHGMSVSTVGTTLVLAEQHHCQRLKDACFEFLGGLKKLDTVVATDGFQHLAKSCPFVLFELIAMLGDR